MFNIDKLFTNKAAAPLAEKPSVEPALEVVAKNPTLANWQRYLKNAGMALVGGVGLFGASLEMAEKIDDWDRQERTQELLAYNRAEAMKSYNLESVDQLEAEAVPAVEAASNEVLLKEILFTGDHLALQDINNIMPPLIDYSQALTNYQKLFEDANTALSAGDSNVVKDLDKNIQAKTQEISLARANYQTALDDVKLSPEQTKMAQRQLEKIIDIIETERTAVMEHIASPKYLAKLSKEMHLSEDEALIHQTARLRNVEKTKVQFLRTINLLAQHAAGYFNKDYALITLPHDSYLEDPEMLDFFKETVRHELWHAATNSDQGIDGFAEMALYNAYQSGSDNKQSRDDSYYRSPTELLVRKKNLDRELEQLGIKKYGEKFSDQHYLKLLDLMYQGKLSDDTREFLEHIKSSKLAQVMNDLAVSDKSPKTYYHSKWFNDDQSGETQPEQSELV